MPARATLYLYSGALAESQLRAYSFVTRRQFPRANPPEGQRMAMRYIFGRTPGVVYAVPDKKIELIELADENQLPPPTPDAPAIVQPPRLENEAYAPGEAALSNAEPENKPQPPPATLEKRALPLKEAAEYLGARLWRVRCLVWSGDLPAYYEGNRQVIDRTDLDAHVEKRKHEG